MSEIHCIKSSIFSLKYLCQTFLVYTLIFDVKHYNSVNVCVRNFYHTTKRQKIAMLFTFFVNIHIQELFIILG